MERYTTIDEFDGEFKGFSYNVEILWDKENHRSICNIYPQGLGYVTKIQKDTYQSAVWELEKLVNSHLEDSYKSNNTKTFLLVRIGCEEKEYIEDFYRSDEEENCWVNCSDEDEIMEEVSDIPGVWCSGCNYYVAIEVGKGSVTSKKEKQLAKLPTEVLKNAHKFVSDRVSEILNNTKSNVKTVIGGS